MCVNWDLYRKFYLLLMVTALLVGPNQTYAEPFNPNTDWFKEAGYGVFVHYLDHIQNNKAEIHSLGRQTSWDECVKEFDCKKFAAQMKEVQAGYVIFTMAQLSPYIIAPNQIYDELTGYEPGQACATRDLVEDLYKALSEHGIPLMLYWTGDGPRKDKKAADGLGGWSGKISEEYVRNWASVVQEYGERYGDKVVGWWVDGCYAHIGYKEKTWGILAKSLKAGNTNRIIALNNPSMDHANSSTDHDDYTTGEVNHFKDVPDGRWRDKKQFHVLSFLGSSFQGWGQPGSKYKKQQLIDYVHKVNENGGVVSIDVLLYRDGSLDRSQLEILRALRPGIEKKKRSTQQWKYKTSVPPGNLACWKPAQLLSLDGDRTLPVNGGGGSLRYARCGVDGDPKTVAQASREWPWTYQVDLMAAYDIKKVVITFGQDGYASHYEVCLSSDSKKWEKAVVNKDHQGGKLSLKVNKKNIRYIRIESHKPDGPNQPGGQMQIAELEVYK